MGLNFTTMTREDFVTICNEHTIAPEVALENEGVVNILKRKVTSVHQDLLQQIELSTYLKENL
jgi:hypothetical protein